MDRQNAFTIEIIDWDNSDLWYLLSEMIGEDCLFDQPNFNKDGIFWIDPDNVSKELFKFKGCFNWLSGSVRLWYNEKPVTRLNYRTPIYVGEGEEMVLDHYDYINFEDVTDVPPIVEEELIY